MSGFKKNDVAEGKRDWSLFPFDGAEGVLRIVEFGARKYERENWRKGIDDPDAQRRIFNATLRHLFTLKAGETIDPESGEHHVLHACCNLLFLSTFAEAYRRGELHRQADEERRRTNPADRSSVEDTTGVPVTGPEDRS